MMWREQGAGRSRLVHVDVRDRSLDTAIRELKDHDFTRTSGGAESDSPVVSPIFDIAAKLHIC